MNVRMILENAAPVMPVLTIDDPELAVPLGQALLDGGMRVVEITLRTPAAIESIAAMREALPELIVGAGTVLTAKLMGAVKNAGGQFAVSPGHTTTLAEAANQCDMPFMPGVVTAGEIQAAMEQGFESLKLFPAEAVGGAALLSGYASVFPGVRFCPTGGIKIENMDRYLSLPNVLCVGGSWIAPRNLVLARNWQSITRLATQAMSGKTSVQD